MPRITAPDVVNKLKINDAISGETIALSYRLPTTEERVKYNNSLWKRERNAFKTRFSETRQRFGKLILAGFEDGAFAKMKDGKESTYSSNPQSPDYDPNWKDLVCEYASDLVEFLAMTVFEGNTRETELLFGDEESPEPSEDPGKNL